MRDFITMLHREWMEWRKVVYIILGIFIALTLLGTYWAHRAAVKMDKNDFVIHSYSEENKVSVQSSDGWGNIQWDSTDSDHPDSLNLRAQMRSEPAKLFEILVGLLRGIMIGINMLILSVSAFYFADALYKERSDASTFYYRSLPISDWVVLGAKFVFGYVGILILSYLLSVIAAMYMPVFVPAIIEEVLGEFNLALSQIDWGHLFLDWGVYHVVQFFWLLPFAMYFLFISASVKGRPLLIGVGILVLVAIVWQLIFGKIGFQNQIVVNLGIFSDLIQDQWTNIPDTLPSDAQVDLFGSFSGYLFTLRTLISLLIGGAFGWGTYYMYRRNIEVT